MRFLFYSHDGLGLGHTRRHLAVAAALAQQAPEASILLATGAEEVVRHGLPRQVEILKLPGLRKDANQAYSSRRLRVSVEEIRALRSALLLTTVKAFQPAVVLVDKHPFGASGEFKAGLRALRKQGGRAVLGLRDILDEPAQVLQEWKPYKMQKRITDFYDQVIVYGDRAIFDPINAYKFPAPLADKTAFCGYVFNRESLVTLENFEWPFPPREKRSRPVVLATTGGGEDGFRTLEAFIRASANAPWQGVAVAGPMTPDAELATLEKLAAECGVTFRNFVPHLSALFGSLDALVCMGGYNTLVEAVALGVPTVCVPRVTPRTEQLIRAEAFERLGLLQVCRPEQLQAEALREQIGKALQTSPPGLQHRARAALNFDGAQQAAGHLLALVHEVAPEAAFDTASPPPGVS
jgi:predicted glycosyltransferase